MKIKSILTLLLVFSLLFSIQGQVSQGLSLNKKEFHSKDLKKTWKTATSNGYTYKYVEGDPSNTRFYKLENGLTVILSPSHKKPKIQTFIAVKAGSKTDPSNHTGLAHYLEHMLFKGTSKYGSKNWEKEKVYIDSIQTLYEEYNSTKNNEKRAAIYAEIDKISGEAAHYAIANEYDKMMTAMGATGTNAFTSFEQTVYTEEIPSNAIDRYLAVQAERFRAPVFRLFHTELEAVYEEKNRSLDSDGSKVFHTMFKLLFPHNNYGKQTTIGTIKDLKNPSLIKIREYFDTYYVPNNMGIIMAGDFNPDKVIAKIDKHFSYMKPHPIPPYTFEPEAPITKPISAEVYGPESERIMMGYRFPGASSEDAQILKLIGEILTNGSAGLIDLDLVQKQKLLNAFAFPYILKDYSTLLLGGYPTKGQSLEEVKDLILQEINKLKNGEFSDDLIQSIINNEKKYAIQQNDSYDSRSYKLMNNFILSTDWARNVFYVKRLETIDKQDIIDFAKKYFKDNYVVIYKKRGEDKHVVKVEKPQITPVVVNRDDQSDFLKKINSIPQPEITPVWLNFEKDIEHASADKYPVLAVKNNDNQLFRVNLYFNTGSWSNKLLPIAVGYLDYIGTKEKSAADFSKAFYKLASSYDVYPSSRNTYVSLNGLQENFKQTLTLFDDLLANCSVDEKAFNAYINNLKKERNDAKKDKGSINRGLRNYAIYGANNPFNHVLSDTELDQLKAKDLIQVLHDLAQYKHKILYFGPKSASEIAAIIEKVHPAPKHFLSLPKPYTFNKVDQTENKVLFTHYDMVQAEIFWVRNSQKYNAELAPITSFFNQYYGGGMGSIVFQTIRESMALAYSTYAYFNLPSRLNDRATFYAYVGTQADKFNDAITAMNTLLTTLSESKKALEIAKVSLRKKLATNRITEDGIIFSYLSAQRKGLDYDIRKKIYTTIPTLNFSDLTSFFDNEIKGKKFTYCILSGKEKVTKEQMQKLGAYKALSLKEIFGY